MNPEVLIRLQQVELEMLDEFVRICTQNGIEYFLDSGTALGAVRHEGFIPWDDDVDVGMMRDEYEKFIRVAPLQLNKKLFLQNKSTDPTYYKYNTKIRLNGSIFPEAFNPSSHKGIFIDIYPFDYVGNTKIEAQVRVNISRILLRLLRLRQTGETRKGIKKILYRVTKIVPMRSYEDLYLNFCAKYKDRKTKYVSCFSYKMLQNNCLFFKTESFSPCKKIQFENREYLIMRDVDDYLTTMYGNYMQLPPESKRVNHLEGTIVFDINKA